MKNFFVSFLILCSTLTLHASIDQSEITMNIKNINVKAFIRMVSSLTKKEFYVDKDILHWKVPGYDKAVNSSQVLSFATMHLSQMGLTLQDQGKYYYLYPTGKKRTIDDNTLLISYLKKQSKDEMTPHSVEGRLIGYKITSIEEHGALEGAGLQLGDIITHINGISITKHSEMTKITAETTLKSYTIVRGNETLVIDLHKSVYH